ncbi:MAG: hypothetical protein ABSH46_04880 [Bryobacteraceae bacterium]|jgi:hypothetical protein
MNRALLGLVLLSAAAAPLAAERDFLTESEIEQVRLAQEPNQRLALYIDFARQRLDQVKQLVKESRPGRSALMHDLLDQYSQIIDAIDTVSDDALARKADISVGTKTVAAAEKGFLPALEKIRDGQPSDLARYEFVLSQAIQATSDSLDTAREDLGKRSSEVADRLKKEQKEREAEMTPDEVAAKKKEDKDAAAKPKKPTLLKPGETVAGQEPASK